MNRMHKYRKITTTVAWLLALLVVVLGAYTRLTNSGLGCPDWPGCYGHLLVKNAPSVAGRSVNVVAAWTEMVHRYCAGTLAMLILLIAILAAVDRKRRPNTLFVPLLLVATVVFQALLGMWTVTLKLLPIVVMGHLLGGLTTLSLLWCHRLQLSVKAPPRIFARRVRFPWYALGLLIVVCQIVLGAWVSTNYAGLACTGFPSCNGEWLPALNLSDAFHIVTKIGPNYEGGLLDSASRTTIQFVHRCGAIVTSIYLLMMVMVMWRREYSPKQQNVMLLTVFLLAIQFSLGVVNVLYLLPLTAAVSHNGVAALLLLCLVTLTYSATNHRGERSYG